MDVREFIAESEKLFIEDEASSRKYIIDRLAEQRKKLVALVNQLDDASLKEHFSVKPETVTGRVRRLYDALIGSVRLYLDGRFGESRERIFSAFFDNTKDEHNPLPSFSAPKGCNYFRIRENPAYSLYRREEIFHIPFERRSAVSNQRFSVSGYPCLYLGSSIYCCWEETNRPNVDTCNVVSMRNTRGLRFIDLSIPGLDEDGFSERSVYQLVLPLACSLRVSDPGVSFKAEYIIPQNVLSCIISRGGEEAGNPPFDGIIYTPNI